METELLAGLWDRVQVVVGAALPSQPSTLTFMFEKRDQSQLNRVCVSALLSWAYELINMNPIL